MPLGTLLLHLRCDHRPVEVRQAQVSQSIQLHLTSPGYFWSWRFLSVPKFRVGAIRTCHYIVVAELELVS
jgi:hypothetical protein